MRTIEEIQTACDRKTQWGVECIHGLVFDLAEHVRRLEREIESLKVDRKPYAGAIQENTGYNLAVDAYWQREAAKTNREVPTGLGWVSDLSSHEVQAYGKAHEEYCRKQEEYAGPTGEPQVL